MSEIAHSLKLFGCLLLLCVAANAAKIPQESGTTRIVAEQPTVRELRGGEQHRVFTAVAPWAVRAGRP